MRAERARALLPVLQLEPRQAAEPDSFCFCVGVEDDEAVGGVVGQRLDQNAVGDAEHHRVQADADREAGDRQARNPLVFQGGTDTEAKVLEEHVRLNTPGTSAVFRCPL